MTWQKYQLGNKQLLAIASVLVLVIALSLFVTCCCVVR